MCRRCSIEFIDMTQLAREDVSVLACERPLLLSIVCAVISYTRRRTPSRHRRRRRHIVETSSTRARLASSVIAVVEFHAPAMASDTLDLPYASKRW